LNQYAIDLYYENPNLCKACGKVIQLRDGQSLYDVRHKKYCNSSCSAVCSNAGSRGRNSSLRLSTKPCPKCGASVDVVRDSNGKPNKAKLCDACSGTPLENRTKGELFTTSKNYQSARSTITHHATNAYKLSGLPSSCKLCGYSLIINVHHIKPVSSFPDTALISEINSLSNLVALCPNHHYEAHLKKRELILS
jgi:hypothetical protein